MTKTTVRINWGKYVEQQSQKTMRGYPAKALDYPEVVEIYSHNDDGTITVITGHNDFGTPLVMRVDPTSEFVSEIAQEASDMERWIVEEQEQNTTEMTAAEAAPKLRDADYWYELQECANTYHVYFGNAASYIRITDPENMPQYAEELIS